MRHTIRKVLTLGILLALPVVLGGSGWYLGGAANKGGATCDVAQDSETDVHSFAVNLGGNTTSTYVASQFSANASYTACAIILQGQKNGSPTFTMSASIYTDDGTTPGSPSVLVGSWSDSVNASGAPAVYGDITFTGLEASLTSGTLYWVVVKTSAVDASNYIYLSSESVAFPEEIDQSSDGSSWTIASGTRCLRYELFSSS